MTDFPGNIKRYQCFPQTYREGRTWFRNETVQAGGELTSATNPHAKGPSGEELATDVAWFGPRNAKRVLVTISGTHGQEYFCGAAIQLQWIVGGGPRSLPDGVAACLVHAHNPYGAAYLSRGNEHFVDLNRNYFEGPLEVRANPLYPELFDLLFTAEMDQHVLDEVMDAYYRFAGCNALQAVMTAMGGGQYTHPTGTLYCGQRPEWSTENLRAIVRNHLGRAEKIALIDWHTGLGGFGAATMLLDPSGIAAEDRWARDWWGGTDPGDALQGATKPQFVGRVAEGVAHDLRARGASVVASVVELGTFENRGVLMALLIDRWLRFACDNREGPHAVTLRTMMMERLNPSLPEWRTAVLARGAEIHMRSLAGLAAWE